MRKLFHLAAVASVVFGTAAAQARTCRTDNPECEGYATFGPAARARCVSIRGRGTTNFCLRAGESHRVYVHGRDYQCSVLGNVPVPQSCDMRWITVGEPR
jgi:hypothetical protein